MALGGLGTLGSLRHPGLGKSAFHGYFTVICHTNLPLIPTPDWLAQDISVSAPGLAYGEPAPLSPLWFAGPSLWSGVLSSSGILLADTGLSHRGGSPPPPAPSCPRP